MSSSESDDESYWNDQLINAVRKKQGTGKIITEGDILREIAEALDQGADIDTTDRKFGNTALHFAVQKGFQKIVEFLRQRGASTDIPNFKGDTAITSAENLGVHEIVRVLAEPIPQQSKSASCESTRASDPISAADNDQPSTSRDNEDVTQYASKQSKTFSAGATLTRSWPGIIYQLKHLVFTLQCALQHKEPYFFLATEMLEAEKLDDVVLLYKDESGKQIGRFVQIKHGNDHNAKISARQLLEVGGNFSILNYFKSWRKVKENPLFSDIESRNMILCTNIGIDLADLTTNKISYVETEEPDRSFELKSRRKRTAWYKVVAKQECNKKVYHELRATSDLHELATQLAQRIHNGKAMRLETDIFQCYHVALVKHVFDPKTKKFHDKFLQDKDLSTRVHKFREIFISEYKKGSMLSENNASEESIWNDVVQQLGKLENFRQDFGKPPKLVPHPRLIQIGELADRFVELLKKAADKNHIVEIVIKKSRMERAEQPIQVIIDNLDQLSGHVLIEDEKKIKFSPHFLKDSEQPPGNIGEFKIALKNKLQNEYELNSFEFRMENYKVCTKRQLLTKYELPDDYVEDWEISNFLEEFTLAVSQPNDDEINEEIRLRIDANSRFNLLNTKLLGCALEEKMLDWFLTKGGRGKEKEYIWGEVGEKFLDELDQEVGSLITIGVNSKHCERMKAFNLHFKCKMPSVKVFLTEDMTHPASHRILQLVVPGKTLLTALRVFDTLERIPKYEKRDSFIFIQLDNFEVPLISKTVMPTFNLQQYPDLLIVDCGLDNIEKYIVELWDPLCEIMARDSNKKIILITQTDTGVRTPLRTRHAKKIEHSALLNPFCQIMAEKIHERIPFTDPGQNSSVQFQINYEKNYDYSFFNLADETQKKLLDNPVTQFQEHDSGTNFGELLGIHDRENIEEAELRDLSEIIDSSTLLDLICEDEIRICNKLESLIEKDYYINRTIRRRVIIRNDIIKDKKVSDLFAISGDHKELSSILVGTAAAEIPPTTQDPRKITILEKSQEEEQFRALCEMYKHHNIHWLKKDAGKYIWEKSRGDITQLVEYRVTGEGNDLYDDNTGLTLSESDNKDNKTNATTIRDEEIAAHNEPVILSSTAGMGKSTMLTYLSWKLKEKQPDMLVIKINLNSHVETFAEVKEKKKCYNVCEENEAMEFLVKELLKRETYLAKKVIRRMIKVKSKVALIFDGFDEISPDYEEIVNNLLGTLARYGIKKLFVATRPHARKALEIKLKVFSHDIQSFSSENQEDFLTKFFNFENHRIEKARALLKKLAKSINDRTNGFTGIPLQTKLVAEIIKNQTPVDIDLRGEFAKLNDDETKFPEEIDLTYLYKYFVEMKFDAFFGKRGANLADIDVRNQRDVEFKRFIETHTKLALDALFDQDKVKEFPLVTTGPEIAIERNGIISHFNDDGRPQFGHRSYAEYLAATFVVGMVGKGNLSEPVKEIFVADILLGDNYQTMRAFINCLWATEHDNVLGVNSGEFRLDERRGAHNRTIFHVAAEEGNGQIITIFLNYLDPKPDNEKELNVAQKVPAKSGCFHAYELHDKHGDGGVDSRNHDDIMLRRVVTISDNIDNLENSSYKKLDILNSRDNFGRTPLYEAAHTCQFNVVEYLCDKGANVNSENNDGSTPLHIAAHEGKLDIVEYLLGKGADVNSGDNDGVTPLHLAAWEGKLDVVEYLLGKGANVNFGDNDGVTPLHLAAREGKLDVVEYLLGKGADVNSGDNDGVTPLHLAAREGKLDVAEYLLGKGANVNSENNNGSTPLNLAALDGKLDVVEYLLGKGANVNSETKKGVTPLHSAAYMGELGVVEYLLGKGANMNSGDNDGVMPLHVAASKGELDVMEYLLGKGANVSSENNDGVTPLHLAAREGKLDVVEYLLGKGANVNSEDNDGWTPLYFATLERKLDVVEYLLGKGANVNSRDNNGVMPLHPAAYKGELDVVEYLVCKGANVNSKNNDGVTPLHSAAYKGELGVVEYLFGKGANVNSRDNDGSMPLHSAAYMGELDVVKYLLDKGASVNSENNNGVTPLHSAARQGKLDVVEYLLGKGANVNSGDSDGWTPLYFATLEGKLDVVEYLLGKGANVNSGDNDGVTPLHSAARKGKSVVMEYLLGKGANVNSRDNDGVTPLHLAAREGKLDVVEYLLGKGANVNSENNNGSTPLHLAAQEGKLDVVEYLLGKGANVNSENNNGSTPLHLAAQEGKLDVVEYLLGKGANVNSGDDDGWSLFTSLLWREF